MVEVSEQEPEEEPPSSNCVVRSRSVRVSSVGRGAPGEPPSSCALCLLASWCSLLCSFEGKQCVAWTWQKSRTIGQLISVQVIAEFCRLG